MLCKLCQTVQRIKNIKEFKKPNLKVRLFYILENWSMTSKNQLCNQLIENKLARMIREPLHSNRYDFQQVD